jgi:hypothetical protein
MPQRRSLAPGRGEVDDDAVFVADHPRVVAGADNMGVSWSQIEFGAIVHLHMEAVVYVV